jgi:Fe-S cluster assembly protein SufD
MSRAIAPRSDVPVEPFLELTRQVDGAGPEWLAAHRRAARERFVELGFPHPKQEEWRQTDVRPLLAPRYGLAAAAGAAPPAADPWLDLDVEHRLVFADGRAWPDAPPTELPEGAWLGPLSAAPGALVERAEAALGSLVGWQELPFAALASALTEDVALLWVPDGVALERPVQIVHWSSGRTAAGDAALAAPRTLVLLGRQAQAQVVEVFTGAGDGAYLATGVTELAVGPEGRLEHQRVQAEPAGAFHVGALGARVERAGTAISRNIALGARLARCDIQFVLAGEGAHGQMDGLYLPSDRQHVDNRTTIDHAVPHCTSGEVYKGILSDRGRAVFVGRIIVRPDAQKTDARQSNASVLLSDDALVHTRPQLEIYADDVKCTHGATVGRLDPEALFYLRTRGIAASDARALLIRSFVAEVIDPIDVPTLRERIADELRARLPEQLG